MAVRSAAAVPREIRGKSPVRRDKVGAREPGARRGQCRRGGVGPMPSGASARTHDRVQADPPSGDGSGEKDVLAEPVLLEKPPEMPALRARDARGHRDVAVSLIDQAGEVGVLEARDRLPFGAAVGQWAV